eukprot:1256959-Rhodomonas_salina.1
MTTHFQAICAQPGPGHEPRQRHLGSYVWKLDPIRESPLGGVHLLSNEYFSCISGSGYWWKNKLYFEMLCKMWVFFVFTERSGGRNRRARNFTSNTWEIGSNLRFVWNSLWKSSKISTKIVRLLGGRIPKKAQYNVLRHLGAGPGALEKSFVFPPVLEYVHCLWPTLHLCTGSTSCTKVSPAFRNVAYGTNSLQCNAALGRRLGMSTEIQSIPHISAYPG